MAGSDDVQTTTNRKETRWTRTKKRHCPACGEEHPVTAFGKDRSAKDGLYRICKVADRGQQKAWREKRKTLAEATK